MQFAKYDLFLAQPLVSEALHKETGNGHSVAAAFIGIIIIHVIRNKKADGADFRIVEMDISQGN